MPSSSRRFEIGPVILVLGALLLLASTFVEWFDPGLTAWNAFEWLDLLLAAIALAVIVGAVGLLLPGRALLDVDLVPLLVAAALAIVAVQLIDPPPAATGRDPSTGAWLALGGCLLMGAGAVLSFGRMRLSISYEGRDPRPRVPAVDARGGGYGASEFRSGGFFDQRAGGSRGTGAGAAPPGSGAARTGASGAPGLRPSGPAGPSRSFGDVGAVAGGRGADAPDPAPRASRSEPPAAPHPAGAAPPGPGSGVESGPAEPAVDPPPAATPAGEGARGSGGLFGSWFDKDPERDPDDAGSGGSKPAGS